MSVAAGRHLRLGDDRARRQLELRARQRRPGHQGAGAGATVTTVHLHRLRRQCATSSATLTITITGTNDAPVAVADGNAGDAVTETGVNPGNTPFPGDPSASGNVLTNDTDVDTGDTRTVTAVNGSAAQRRQPVVGTYGSVTIAPTAPGATARQRRPGHRCAGAGRNRHRRLHLHRDRRAWRHLAAALTITITGTNDAPVAVADANAGDPVVEIGVIPGNIPFAGDPTATGNVLTNDTDVDNGDTKTVSAVNGSAGNVGKARVGNYGTVTINADGSWSYALNNGDPDTNALAQGADGHGRVHLHRARRERRHLVYHADHHHHRHQRRAGRGRHQCRRPGDRDRRQPG